MNDNNDPLRLARLIDAPPLRAVSDAEQHAHTAALQAVRLTTGRYFSAGDRSAKAAIRTVLDIEMIVTQALLSAQPWPQEVQPDGTIHAVDPVDMAPPPVNPERQATVRDAIGQTISDFMGERGGNSLDWCDSNNCDALADEIVEAMLALPRNTPVAESLPASYGSINYTATLKGATRPAVMGSTSSSDPHKDLDDMMAFLELSYSAKRGTEILPYKVGYLWVTSKAPQ